MRHRPAGSGLARGGVLLLVATGAITLGASVVSPAAMRAGKVVGIAKLESANSKARGRAELQIFPRHGEVDLTVRRFPRPDGEIFMVWLTRSSGRAYIGGAFPRNVLGRFDLSTVVPGSTKVSRRHTERSQRVVITHLPRGRAKNIAREARADGWRDAEPITGTRVVRGKVADV